MQAMKRWIMAGKYLPTKLRKHVLISVVTVVLLLSLYLWGSAIAEFQLLRNPNDAFVVGKDHATTMFGSPAQRRLVGAHARAMQHMAVGNSERSNQVLMLQNMQHFGEGHVTAATDAEGAAAVSSRISMDSSSGAVAAKTLQELTARVVTVPCDGTLPTRLKKGSILMWACKQVDASFADDWAIERIYDTLDTVVLDLQRIRKTTGAEVVVWAAGPALINSGRPDSDASLLMLYQVFMHVVRTMGFVVLPVRSVEDIAVPLSIFLHHMPVVELHALEAPRGLPMSLNKECQTLLLTRKYKRDCLPVPAELMPVLVTGLGGAATHEISKRLQEAGARMPHEALGPDGAVSWLYAVNDAIIGQVYPFGGEGALSTHQPSALSPRFERVFHVVREPLAHMSSFTGHLQKSYAFLVKALMLPSQVKALPLLQQHQSELQAVTSELRSCARGDHCNANIAALGYLLWNAVVSAQADRRYRVESGLGNLLNDVCEELGGCRGANKPGTMLVKVKERNINHVHVRLEDVRKLPLWDELVKAAHTYGYDDKDFTR